MEKIELRVEQRAGERLDKPWSAVFGLAGGTVGRGGQNKLILPDPEASIARVHAMVRLGTSEAYIANLCERRLIVVDGHEVRPGEEVLLPLGASVGIGPYQIKVCAINAESVPSTHTPPPFVPVGMREFAPSPPSLAPEVTAVSALGSTSGTPIAADANPLSSFTKLAEPVDSVLQQLGSGAPAASTFPDAFAPGGHPAPEAHVQQPARALFIPDDFNPFEVVSRPTPKDEWGGLQAQSLTELAQQSHDGLIKALPLSGGLDGTLDNPAHSGLPKQLDPTPELDPLALFTQSSILASPELVDAPAGRSSELSHVFHLPTTQRTDHTRVGAPQEFEPVEMRPPGASAESLQAVQSVGLQTVQGLDLSLFGQGGAVPATDALFSQPRPQIQSVAVPTTSLAPELPPSSQPITSPSLSPVTSDVALQAFGLSLSGDAPAPTQPVAPIPAMTTLPNATNATTSPAPSPPGNLEALSAAFLEGAGLTPERARLELTPEFMRTFGEAFRVAIEGSIDLLAARSEIKQEFRAGVTIIASSANNPLKFLPNADGVIMQMVGQHFPGFMKPLPAIKEAFGDLRVHQLALMAGIRAAYSEALMRFDPLKMEEAAPKAGLFGNLYDGARKAALWDEYKKNFSQLKNSAEDDLTAFSGQTFVQAYEQAASAARGET